MVVMRVAASVACMASLATAFLPAAPVCRGSIASRSIESSQQKWRVMSSLQEKEEETSSTPKMRDDKSFEEEMPHEAMPDDIFVVRKDIKDWADLTPEERTKLEEETSEMYPTEGHSTFIPHNHPFAHARILNVVQRVADLGRTLKFYEAVGLIQLRDRVSTDYTATVMGFGSEEFGQNIAVQFVQEKSGTIDVGDGYQGITVTVPDVASAVSKAQAAGGRVIQPTATLEFAATQIPDQDAQEINAEVKAVLTDPDGYRVTLIQDPVADLKFVSLRVYDQEQAVAFYNTLGMKLLYKRANLPVETSMSAGVGYDDDHVYTMGFVHPKLKEPQFHMFPTTKAMLELKYEYDSKEIRVGTGMAQLVVGVYHGVDRALEHLRSAGAKVLKEASADDKGDVAAVADVDGYVVTLVDIEQFNSLLA